MTLINFDETKVKDINDTLAEAMHGCYRIVYIKTNMFIHCQTITECKEINTSAGKKKNTGRFFDLKSVKNIIGARISVGSQPYIVIDKDIVKTTGEYTGYYIHQDLFVEYIKWLDPTKEIQFNNLLNIILHKQAKQEEITLKEINQSLQQKVDQLEKEKDQAVQQLKILTIDKLYFMINDSMPGIQKFGWTNLTMQQRAKELNKTTGNYYCPTDWYFVDDCFVEITKGRGSEDILFDQNVDTRIYQNRELFKFISKEDSLKKLQAAKEAFLKGDYVLSKQSLVYLPKYISFQKEEPGLSKKELVAEAKERNIPGRDGLKKEELIKLIEQDKIAKIQPKETKASLIEQCAAIGVFGTNHDSIDELKQKIRNKTEHAQIFLDFFTKNIEIGTDDQFIKVLDVVNKYKEQTLLKQYDSIQCVEDLRIIVPGLVVKINTNVIVGGISQHVRNIVYGLKFK